MDLLLRNGLVVTDGLELNTDLVIDEGVVRAMGDFEGLEATEIIDCTGKILLPGAVDLGLNLLDDGPLNPESSMGIGMATRDAALGGVTTVIGTLEVREGESAAEAIRKQSEGDARKSFTDFGFHLLVNSWNSPRAAQAREAILEGVPSFWIARAGIDTELPFPALLHAALADLPENALAIAAPFDALMYRYLFQRGGAVGPARWNDVYPECLESCFVNMAAEMARTARARLLLGPLTCAESIRSLQAARESSTRLYGAVGLPHLFFTDDNAPPRIWPPARARNDQQALFAALDDGLVSAVLSCHKPRTADEAQGTVAGPPLLGVPGYSRFLPLMHSEGIAKWRLSFGSLSQCCAADPARLAGIYPRKGSLQAGSDADFVILDPNRETTPGSRTGETFRVRYFDPLADTGFAGFIERVYLRGRLVVEDGHMAGQPGGEFLQRRMAIR